MKRIIAMSIITISAVMFVHPASATVTAKCSQPNCRRICNAQLDRCLKNGGGQRCRQVFHHCVRRCTN